MSKQAQGFEASAALLPDIYSILPVSPRRVIKRLGWVGALFFPSQGTWGRRRRLLFFHLSNLGAARI